MQGFFLWSSIYLEHVIPRFADKEDIYMRIGGDLVREERARLNATRPSYFNLSFTVRGRKYRVSVQDYHVRFGSDDVWSCEVVFP